MPLLPADPWALVAFVAIFGGTIAIAVTKAPKAYSLALLILGVFFLQNFGGAGGLFPDLALRTGPFLGGEQWWTPVTYMYLHAGFFHLIGNLIILVTAGPALEDRVGARWFFGIYFAAGFAAAGAHVAFTELEFIRDAAAVGASGAIFGILTAFAVRWPRDRLPMALGFIILMLPAFLVLLIHLGLNLAIMFQSGTSVAWYGHFAGYLVGLPAALYFEKTGIDIRRGTGTRRRIDFPDFEKLRPLARDPEMGEMLEKASKFTGEHQDDAVFAEAWVERIIARARCPTHEAPLTRHGYEAYCPHGDYTVEFARRVG